MMITCEEASKLISESMDHRLPIAKRWSLRFHLLLCDMCRNYLEQMKSLRQFLKQWQETIFRHLPGTGLSPEAKSKIKLKI